MDVWRWTDTERRRWSCRFAKMWCVKAVRWRQGGGDGAMECLKQHNGTKFGVGDPWTNQNGSGEAGMTEKRAVWQRR